MLTLKPSKETRLAFVAITALLTTAGIAAAQQQGTLPNTMPGQNGGVNAPVAVGEQGLRPMLLRVAQYAQSAQTRSSATTTDARTSYSAASKAFGDLLRTLGEPMQPTGVRNTDSMPQITTVQAANDIRLLKSAAKKAQSTEDAERFRKAASLYATGAKELVTGQLREALLDESTEPVILRGDPQEADAGIPKPANPAPAPNPAPMPNPVPAPNPEPNPVPNPNPAPPDPNNPPVPPQTPDPTNPPETPGNPPPNPSGA
ncbi:MAG: hypothetical protein H7Y38_15700, partial [Armatimonadetes bacterium]|nr:hypothetical protein [Armatimonadota bacterium]